eukprot:snap_masked-scaffold_10-processed-gene-11.30-mRNA-1 protein AED:1.00 eAED:1.00 QI:0/0/0/0/1/1/2/0/94
MGVNSTNVIEQKQYFLTFIVFLVPCSHFQLIICTFCFFLKSCSEISNWSITFRKFVSFERKLCDSLKESPICELSESVKVINICTMTPKWECDY